MNYEKLHKDTITRLHQMVNSGKITVKTACGICADFVPESEDERIRKEIKNFLSRIMLGQENFLKEDYDWNAWMAWLEKQGETFTKKDVDDAYLKGVCDTKQELEKQAEQKPADKAEPKFKVKYAGSEYNVLETKNIAGVTFYGIEDEPNHIDYVQAENCERVDGYSIKESGSPFPTKPAKFSEQKPAWSEEDESMRIRCIGILETYCAEEASRLITWLKSLKDRIGG